MALNLLKLGNSKAVTLNLGKNNIFIVKMMKILGFLAISGFVFYEFMEQVLISLDSKAVTPNLGQNNIFNVKMMKILGFLAISGFVVYEYMEQVLISLVLAYIGSQFYVIISRYCKQKFRQLRIWCRRAFFGGGRLNQGDLLFSLGVLMLIYLTLYVILKIGYTEKFGEIYFSAVSSVKPFFNIICIWLVTIVAITVDNIFVESEKPSVRNWYQKQNDSNLSFLYLFFVFFFSLCSSEWLDVLLLRGEGSETPASPT